jgi:hypothetical protein
MLAGHTLNRMLRNRYNQQHCRRRGPHLSSSRRYGHSPHPSSSRRYGAHSRRLYRS